MAFGCGFPKIDLKREFRPKDVKNDKRGLRNALSDQKRHQMRLSTRRNNSDQVLELLTFVSKNHLPDRFSTLNNHTKSTEKKPRQQHSHRVLLTSQTERKAKKNQKNLIWGEEFKGDRPRPKKEPLYTRYKTPDGKVEKTALKRINV